MIVKLAVVGLLVLLGEAGHLLLEEGGEELAHHLLHGLFLGGAAIVFGAYVLRGVRSNGLPSFTWRLKPRAHDAGRGSSDPAATS